MKAKTSSTLFAVLAIVLYCGAAIVSIRMLGADAGNAVFPPLLVVLLVSGTLLVTGSILIRRRAVK